MSKVVIQVQWLEVSRRIQEAIESIDKIRRLIRLNSLHKGLNPLGDAPEEDQKKIGDVVDKLLELRLQTTRYSME